MGIIFVGWEGADGGGKKIEESFRTNRGSCGWGRSMSVASVTVWYTDVP
jgi:hypothetical protein